MSEHPGSWGIPADIFNDPRKATLFGTAVSQTLTDWRSKAKRKVCVIFFFFSIE